MTLSELRIKLNRIENPNKEVSINIPDLKGFMDFDIKDIIEYEDVIVINGIDREE